MDNHIKIKSVKSYFSFSCCSCILQYKKTFKLHFPEAANSPRPQTIISEFILSEFTTNNEVYVSQEDGHLTHLSILQPEDHSDEFLAMLLWI